MRTICITQLHLSSSLSPATLITSCLHTTWVLPWSMGAVVFSFLFIGSRSPSARLLFFVCGHIDCDHSSFSGEANSVRHSAGAWLLCDCVIISTSERARLPAQPIYRGFLLPHTLLSPASLSSCLGIEFIGVKSRLFAA